jgi:type III pantothenate kinase
MRFLAIDIGNTSIHGAFRNGARWEKHFRVATRKKEKKLRRELDKYLGTLKDAEVYVASVVPSAGPILRRYFAQKKNVRFVLVGEDVRVPITNRYSKPKQVGVDRLLNALAVYKKYKKAAIVIDFGTAITFDVVNAKGEYLGGVIAPGIEISIEALFRKTALLPRIQLRHPKGSIGKDTVNSIRIGCAVGIGGLCDRITETIAGQLKTRPKIIATGGYAPFMRRYTHAFNAIARDLTLDGIFFTRT